VNEVDGSASHAPAAVYERELDASVERIWENVLDWEHLPYLHAQSFTSVRMTSQDANHWCGEVGLPDSGGSTVELDVRLDRPNLRYTTRTVSGTGAGTAIVTQMFPRSEHRTGIRVEFFLPWAPAGAESAIGEIYRNIYVTLWDQDEAMMRERQRVLDDGMRERQRVLDEGMRERQRVLDDGMRERQRVLDATPEGSAEVPRSISLGRVRDLAEKLPMNVELGGRHFRVVSVDGRLFAHDTRCPHLGGPLNEGTLEGCELMCPWHGYRFDLATGRSSDGRSFRMAPPAVVEIDACGGEVSLRLP
jgi:nitrite reductase/ring-hydroxylating ferredoxin subunit